MTGSSWQIPCPLYWALGPTFDTWRVKPSQTSTIHRYALFTCRWKRESVSQQDSMIIDGSGHVEPYARWKWTEVYISGKRREATCGHGLCRRMPLRENLPRAELERTVMIKTKIKQQHASTRGYHTENDGIPITNVVHLLDVHRLLQLLLRGPVDVERAPANDWHQQDSSK